MSRFKLIMIEVEPSPTFPSYDLLDHKREIEFRVYESSYGEYGNRYENLLMSTPNMVYAKAFLRSCRLIDGIEINIDED